MLFFGWIAYRSLVTCELPVLVVYVDPVLCLYLNSSVPSYFFIRLPLHTTLYRLLHSSVRHTTLVSSTLHCFTPLFVPQIKDSTNFSLNLANKHNLYHHMKQPLGVVATTDGRLCNYHLDPDLLPKDIILDNWLGVDLIIHGVSFDPYKQGLSLWINFTIIIVAIAVCMITPFMW